VNKVDRKDGIRIVQKHIEEVMGNAAEGLQVFWYCEEIY